jgi:hypothetical protein
MDNTKARHAEIYAAAVAVLATAGGVEAIDSLDQVERLPRLRSLYRQVVEATGCHPDTAKRNVAKAMRRARYQIVRERDDWGGAREGAGRPRIMEDKMITVKVSVTAECEGLLHSMPRGYEYELVAEDYNDDGSGTVEFIIHDVDELTAAMEQSLNTNPGVVSYVAVPSREVRVEDGNLICCSCGQRLHIPERGRIVRCACPGRIHLHNEIEDLGFRVVSDDPVRGFYCIRAIK